MDKESLPIDQLSRVAKRRGSRTKAILTGRDSRMVRNSGRSKAYFNLAEYLEHRTNPAAIFAGFCDGITPYDINAGGDLR